MADVGIWLGIIATALGILVTLGGLTKRFGDRLSADILVVVRSELQSSEARMEIRAAGLDARFDAVDARFDAVDARFDAVDARFDAVDARFDAVDARFDQLEERLTSRIDSLERVTDVRLAALETDMHLVKQHLLGNPTAA